MGIGRRHFDQGRVDGHGAGFKQAFNFAEIDGSVVRAAVVDGVPHIGADEYGIVPEVAGHFGGYVRRAPHGHHVNDFNVKNIWPARANIVKVPVADGGDGTMEVLVECHPWENPCPEEYRALWAGKSKPYGVSADKKTVIIDISEIRGTDKYKGHINNENHRTTNDSSTSITLFLYPLDITISKIPPTNLKF